MSASRPIHTHTQCRPSCFIPQFIFFFFHRDTKKQTIMTTDLNNIRSYRHGDYNSNRSNEMRRCGWIKKKRMEMGKRCDGFLFGFGDLGM